MSRPVGFRLLAADADPTASPIRPPWSILHTLVDRPDPTIFDVGASTGATTERLLATFERPTIHCFEPLPDACGVLQQRFGGHPDIRLNNVALGDRVGIASLHRSSHTDTASLLAMARDSWWAQAQEISPAEPVTVALDTIDHYCASHAITAVDLLKLDVQGAEPECLRGAQAMLAAGAIGVVQAEIILHGFYARRGSFGALEALLAPHGFRLLTVFDVLVDAAGELLQLDTIYVREPR